MLMIEGMIADEYEEYLDSIAEPEEPTTQVSEENQ